MTVNKDDKNSSIDKELDAILKIKDFRLICEANIVSILWGTPDLFFNYEKLSVKSFSHN